MSSDGRSEDVIVRQLAANQTGWVSRVSDKAALALTGCRRQLFAFATYRKVPDADVGRNYPLA